jgi:DNA-binding transcriptional LysR family regulator
VELRHLHYFRTVAEELHFGRAAERLHIAQPPLSQQIRQLEQEIEFQLFFRNNRNVALTPAGAAFLAEVNRIFQQLDRAIEIGKKTSRGELGQIAIGFVGSATYNILPIVLREFRDRYPQVHIDLHELTTDLQLTWLQADKIDVGLIRPPIKASNLLWETVFSESLVVVLPATHCLANTTAIDLQSIANDPFILFPPSLAPGLYQQIIALCETAGFTPQIVQEGIQMQTIISLVSAAMGVSILPASIQQVQRQGVVYKPLQTGSPQVSIAIAWRSSDISPTVQRFLEIALDN